MLLEQNYVPSITIDLSAMVGYISIVIFSRYAGRPINSFGGKTIFNPEALFLLFIFVQIL
ncbi:MAG: hypothetical protein D4R68_05690 [Ignavibacteriales bacterium]|nr:MAG: hypothetical protein D4R68_05690 [Ignavibacteriales bacterium]